MSSSLLPGPLWEDSFKNQASSQIFETGILFVNVFTSLWFSKYFLKYVWKSQKQDASSPCKTCGRESTRMKRSLTFCPSDAWFSATKLIFRVKTVHVVKPLWIYLFTKLDGPHSTQRHSGQTFPFSHQSFHDCCGFSHSYFCVPGHDSIVYVYGQLQYLQRGTLSN